MLLLNFVKILFAFLGIGLVPGFFSTLLLRKQSFNLILFFVLSILLGQSVLLVASTWLFYSNLSLPSCYKTLAVCITALNLVSLLIAFILRKKLPRFSSIKELVVIIFCAAFVAYLPTIGLLKNESTTAFRLGPDGALYAATTQALTAGERINKPIFTNNSLLLHSLAQSGLRIHHRVGFPFLAAFAQWLTNTKYPHQILFALGLVVSFTIFLLSFLFLHDVGGLPKLICGIVSSLIALNSNYINVLFENQFPNLFFIPFTFFGIILTMKFRQTKKWRLLFPAVLTFAGALSVYAEGALAIAVFFLFLFIFEIIDRVLFKTDNIIGTQLLFWIFSLILSLIVLWPYSYVILPHLFHIKTGAGYPQPVWAMLSEILGLGNIYGQMATWTDLQVHTTSRPFSGYFFHAVISLFILTSIYHFIKTSKNRAVSKLLLVLLMTLLFSYLRCLSMDLNYTYYKMYTIFLPAIACGIFIALSHEMTFLKIKNKVQMSLLLCAAILVVGSTIEYLEDYRRSGYIMSSSDFEIHDQTMQLPQDAYLVFPPWGRRNMFWFMIDRSRGTYLSALSKIPVIDNGQISIDVLPTLGNNKLFYLNIFEGNRIRNKANAVFSNSSFSLFDTHLTLNDLVKNSGGSKTLDFEMIWANPNFN